MTTERGLNGLSDGSSTEFTDGTDLPCEKNYRTSRYFQEDRLRCSEAAEDLRLMKALMASFEAMSLQKPGKVLAFQPVMASGRRTP